MTRIDGTDSQQRLRIHSLLLAWYAGAGRHYLPWRQTRDPYAILVAEIMLQQTQVERVLPKYTAFLDRFPTIAALVEAPTSEVIRAWSGLGYNLRAVRLQEIARQVTQVYAGKLPRALEELKSLKGVGRYTAGAIACFAFDLPVATVDTNIRRVLWRVFRGIEPAAWPAGVRGEREMISLAEWALPEPDAYSWQQALMDLGATICLSRRPLCESCPLAGDCSAYAEIAGLTLFSSGEALARVRAGRTPSPPDLAAAAREATPERVGRAVAEDTPGYAGAASLPKSGLPKSGRRRQDSGTPFTQTSRYFRGRVVEILRGLAPDESLGMAELGPLVRPDFAEDTPGQMIWLAAILQGLARDGLVRLVDGEESELPHSSEQESFSRIRVELP